ALDGRSLTRWIALSFGPSLPGRRPRGGNEQTESFNRTYGGRGVYLPPRPGQGARSGNRMGPAVHCMQQGPSRATKKSKNLLASARATPSGQWLRALDPAAGTGGGGETFRGSPPSHRLS